jgi:hypothetical protein
MQALGIYADLEEETSEAVRHAATAFGLSHANLGFLAETEVFWTNLLAIPGEDRAARLWDVRLWGRLAAVRALIGDAAASAEALTRARANVAEFDDDAKLVAFVEGQAEACSLALAKFEQATQSSGPETAPPDNGVASQSQG